MSESKSVVRMNKKMSYLNLLSLLATGCSLITARPGAISSEERIKVFPTTGLNTRGKLSIGWEDHMIPFITAENDEDSTNANKMLSPGPVSAIFNCGAGTSGASRNGSFRWASILRSLD